MSWLLDLVTWCAREGREDVENWVAWSQGHGSDVPRDQLARRVVSQQAHLAAGAAVTPGAVATIPGIRGGLAAGQISSEVGFVLYRMVKTILYQAAVYGHDQDKDVVDRVLLVLGLALGNGETRRALVGGGRRSAAKVVSAIAGRGGTAAYADLLARDVAERFGGKGQHVYMPIVGRPFFGAENFIFISAAALAGRYIFNDLELTPEELADLDEHLRAWSRSVLGLMLWMARADGHVDLSENRVIETLRHSLVMPGIPQDSMEKELKAAPDWEQIRRQFRTDDERAGLLENLLMVVWADGVKTAEEDRLVRRVSAELVADRMLDTIESGVRLALTGHAETDVDPFAPGSGTGA